MTVRKPDAVMDVLFDEARNVWDIRYRLHPLDVGFDLRKQRMSLRIDRADDPIRMSYPDKAGIRRVIEGSQIVVLRYLRGLGFQFERKHFAAESLGRRGGKAGTGAVKARTSTQARTAAEARWGKYRKKMETSKP